MSTKQLYRQAVKELQKLILEEKIKNTPNIEIGKKYGKCGTENILQMP